MGDRPVIPVVWVDSHITCWDQAMVANVLSDPEWPIGGEGPWPTGYEFEHWVVKLDDPTIDLDRLAADVDGAVLVVPARHHATGVEVDVINRAMATVPWVLVVLTSDEERVFPVEKLDHPNMVVWVQTPAAGDNPDWVLPVGWPPHLPGLLRDINYPEREGWFFAGQVNNRRRKECVEVLRDLDNGRLVETPGFTQGLAHDEYAAGLAHAKVVPCPSGPQTVDTFRVWEALEAGCIPVVDEQTPQENQRWYWPLLTGSRPPFPTIKDWSTFPQQLADLEAGWPANANRVSAWWQGYKRRLADRISDTVRNLSGVMPEPGDVTVLIPTSPIAAHPDTSLIETTVASVRYWLPDAEIIVMCDGIRPEQEHYRQRYEEYLNRLLWLTGTRWDRVLPVVHDEHLHQAGMTRRALDLVRTPLVLFAEHDCPIVTDCPIDFPALAAACLSGEADLIRLHHEALVLPDHEHLMLDREPQDIHGAPLLRTVQWSQRPHLANTGFYRRLLAEDFPAAYIGMVEDKMHSVVESAWRDFGPAGWHRYRLWMYSPEGQIKRSYTLDGRGTDEKWVDS
jgi:hypothetical protein